MLDSLPISVYVPGASPLHRLHARTKLLVLAWLACALFVGSHRRFHVGTYAVAFVALAGGLLLARVDLRYVWRRLRLLLVLLALGIPFTLAWTPGTTWHTFDLLSARILGVPVAIQVVITYDGIWLVLSYTTIFLLLYVGTMLVTLTTSPVALAEAIVLLLRPLRRVGLPADEFGLLTLIALRFIPTLIEEAEQLVKAQVSRGADFATGSLNARLRALGTLLIPLVQGALRRAEGLASALEARGYGVIGTATLLHEGPLGVWDWLVLVAVPALTIIAYFRL